MTKKYTEEYIAYMISMIRKYLYYDAGVLENMDGTQVKEIFERLVDGLLGI